MSGYSYITGLAGKSFSNGSSYRNALSLAGYKDLGWQNGWNYNNKNENTWKDALRNGERVEEYQWNKTGSDVTRVLHKAKMFCSVDMGD